MFFYTEIEQPVVAAAPEETLQSPQSPVPDIVNKVLATPAVRGLAKEHNLNLTDIKVGYVDCEDTLFVSKPKIILQVRKIFETCLLYDIFLSRA